MPVVIVLTGPNNGDYHPVTDTPLVVGRENTCDLQIVDPSVSRKHLELRLDSDGGTCVAKNLSSTNAMTVNNVETESDARLGDGDVVQIGDTLLLYAAQEFKDVETAVNYYRSPTVGIEPTILPRSSRAP